MALSTENISLANLKKNGKLIMGNDDASLVDLGEGVCCLEMHTQGQILSEAFIDFIPKALGEAEKNYKGMVIGNQEECFCGGVDLSPVLKAAQAKDINFLDNFVKKYQDAMMAIKYSPIPVVGAPFQKTLGGGLTLILHCDRICATNETYMGLVEAGVGLIPWGGAIKELLIRYTEGLRDDIKVNLLEYNQKVQAAAFMCKVTTSARYYGKDKGQELGFLRKTDKVTANQENLLNDAKRMVLAMDLEGYEPPEPKKIRIYGEPGLAMLEQFIYAYDFVGKYISEYEMKVAKEIAYVLCGGPLKMYDFVSEHYLLNVEREAFLRLCGEEKTQERISHMLNTGKVLRN